MGAWMVPRERQREEIGFRFLPRRAGSPRRMAVCTPPNTRAGLGGGACGRAGATVVDGTRVTSVARGGLGFRLGNRARREFRADAVVPRHQRLTRQRDAAPWLARRASSRRQLHQSPRRRSTRRSSAAWCPRGG
jgi:hypothetical protein